MPPTFWAQARAEGASELVSLGRCLTPGPSKHKGREGIPCRKMGSGCVATVWSSPKWNEGVNQRKPPGSGDT